MARILIVDDDIMFLSLLRDLLAPEGHDILEATNGIEALDIFREASVDLVVTDIVMPEKEGLQTILELKKESPTSKIIAISGGGRPLNTNEDYLTAAKEFGAAVTFSKPFRPTEFLQAVRELLDQPSDST